MAPCGSPNFWCCFRLLRISRLSSNKPSMQVSCTCDARIWFCIEVAKRNGVCFWRRWYAAYEQSIFSVESFRRNDSSMTASLSHLELVVNHRIDEKRKTRKENKKYGATRYKWMETTVFNEIYRLGTVGWVLASAAAATWEKSKQFRFFFFQRCVCVCCFYFALETNAHEWSHKM